MLIQKNDYIFVIEKLGEEYLVKNKFLQETYDSEYIAEIGGIDKRIDDLEILSGDKNEYYPLLKKITLRKKSWENLKEQIGLKRSLVKKPLEDDNSGDLSQYILNELMGITDSLRIYRISADGVVVDSYEIMDKKSLSLEHIAKNRYIIDTHLDVDSNNKIKNMSMNIVFSTFLWHSASLNFSRNKDGKISLKLGEKVLSGKKTICTMLYSLGKACLPFMKDTLANREMFVRGYDILCEGIEDKYIPVEEYKSEISKVLDSLPPLRKDRTFEDYVDVVLESLEGEEQRNLFKDLYTTMMCIFIKNIYRSANDKIIFGMCPVLHGSQGLGKTYFITAPFNFLEKKIENETVMTYGRIEQLSDMNVTQAMFKSSVVIFDDIGVMQDRQIVQFKDFISRNSYTRREIYTENTLQIPRRFVAFGTTNEYGWIKDGENRKFPTFFLKKKLRRVDWNFEAYFSSLKAIADKFEYTERVLDDLTDRARIMYNVQMTNFYKETVVEEIEDVFEESARGVIDGRTGIIILPRESLKAMVGRTLFRYFQNKYDKLYTKYRTRERVGMEWVPSTINGYKLIFRLCENILNICLEKKLVGYVVIGKKICTVFDYIRIREITRDSADIDTAMLSKTPQEKEFTNKWSIH